jgi:hypothetical protein
MRFSSKTFLLFFIVFCCFCCCFVLFLVFFVVFVVFCWFFVKKFLLLVLPKVHGLAKIMRIALKTFVPKSGKDNTGKDNEGGLYMTQIISYNL